jgi:hypothetical protein
MRSHSKAGNVSGYRLIPRDEGAESVRRQGCELFNRGAFVAAATSFVKLKAA